MRMRISFYVLLAMMACNLPAWSQQAATDLKAGESMIIEGTISDLQMTPGQGPPFLQVKTSDGTMYTVHFGPIMALRRKGFEPKLTDTVVVSGEFCCVVNGRQVIRSSRIVLNGVTFATPIPPGDLSMLPQGGGAAPGAPMNMQGGCCAQGSGMTMAPGGGMNMQGSGTMQGGSMCANMPGGCPMMQQGMGSGMGMGMGHGKMNMQGGGMGQGGGMNMPGGATGTTQGGCCAQGSGMTMGPGGGMNMQGSGTTQGGSMCANMPGGCPMMQQQGAQPAK